MYCACRAACGTLSAADTLIVIHVRRVVFNCNRAYGANLLAQFAVNALGGVNAGVHIAYGTCLDHADGLLGAGIITGRTSGALLFGTYLFHILI